MKSAFQLSLPVLCTVRLHEILVGVEEDSPVLIDAGHPDGQHRSLQSGAEIDLLCPLLRVFPHEKPDIVTTRHSHLPIFKLNSRVL